MSKSIKKTLICIAFGVGLYVLLTNIGSFFGFFGTLYQLMLPVVLGFIIAFVLNVPMKGFKLLFDKLFKKAKKRPPEKLVDLVCVILVFILLAFFLWAILSLAIPSLMETVGDVIKIVQEQMPKIKAFLEENSIDPTVVEKVVDFLRIDEDYNMNFNFGAIIAPLFTTVKSMLATIVNLIFALVVCIYALLSKAELHLSVRRLAYSILPERIARYFGHVYVLVRDTYTRFLSAQCIEAVILGIMMFLAFLIFDIPYAGLVAVLTALFAFLPYIGAFGACFVGAFLTVVSEPEKVILCIVVYTLVQFTENHFVYPHVVGYSVGLSSLWTLVAALIGGSLLGLFGMIFFIPLSSVVATLLHEFTTWRLEKKKLIISDEQEPLAAEQVAFEFNADCGNESNISDDNASADYGAASDNESK